MNRPGSSSSTSTRRDFPPAPSPPPTIPLPPIPSPRDSASQSPSDTLVFPSPPIRPRLRTLSHQPDTGIIQDTLTSSSSPNSLHRFNSTLKRFLPPASPPTPSSPSTGMMFDLDPELAMDPFAAPSPTPASLSRLEREQAAYVRSRDDIRRIKMQTGEDGANRARRTPPPRYELDGPLHKDVGRAV